MLQSWALLLGICLVAPTSSAYAQNIDWEKIDAAFGRNAVVTADVHRHSFPRSDLPVTLDGVTLKPGFALGGWMAFEPMGSDALGLPDFSSRAARYVTA